VPYLERVLATQINVDGEPLELINTACPRRRKPQMAYPCLPRKEFGRRLDHIFASEALRLMDCGYFEDWRRSRNLSDHAPMWAEFDWP
jgi:endonuclease/exonuclease/phosphatase family metal-dependent hydrolase